LAILAMIAEIPRGRLARARFTMGTKLTIATVLARPYNRIRDIDIENTDYKRYQKEKLAGD